MIEKEEIVPRKPMTEKEEMVLLVTVLIKDWDDYVAANLLHIRSLPIQNGSTINIGDLKKDWLEVFADYAADKILEVEQEN